MQTQAPLVAAVPALPPADLGKRFLAAFLDGLCVLPVSWIPGVGVLAFIAWMLCRDLVFGGQSVGKKVLGLKVVDAQTGRVPPAPQLLLRNALHAVPCVGPVVEAIVLLTSKSKAKLGDGWAKAMVVEAR